MLQLSSNHLYGSNICTFATLTLIILKIFVTNTIQYVYKVHAPKIMDLRIFLWEIHRFLQKPSETLNTLRAIYNYALYLLKLPIIHTLSKYQCPVTPVTIRLLAIK